MYFETFNETGLPWNVVWSVNVNGSEWSVGTRSDIRVPLPNGTYSYTLTNQWGRQVRSPSVSGTFVVAGPIDHVVDPQIPVGPDPYSVAYDPANGYLYVANKGSSNLTVIDGAIDRVVIASISVTNEPYALAYDPENNEIFVASAGSNEVDVIDATPNEVVAYIGVGAQPEGIAYVPVNAYVYVANEHSDNLTAIYGALPVIATDWEVAPFYGVTFSERGLAPNTNWTVSVAGFSKSSVAGTNVTVTLPNGTYTFRATTRNPIYIGVDATVTVRGAPTRAPTAVFVLYTVPVTFVENGLPTGQRWWVHVSGEPATNGTIPEITIFVANGSYAFSTSAPGYVGSSGTFLVGGEPVTRTVAFSPAGIPWWGYALIAIAVIAVVTLVLGTWQRRRRRTADFVFVPPPSPPAGR